MGCAFRLDVDTRCLETFSWKLFGNLRAWDDNINIHKETKPHFKHFISSMSLSYFQATMTPLHFQTGPVLTGLFLLKIA